MLSLMFARVRGGLGVKPDADDNPDSHVVPSHGPGARVNRRVLNDCVARGNVTSGVEIGEVFFTDRQSRFLDPVPVRSDWGFGGLGRLAASQYLVLMFVSLGSGLVAHTRNSAVAE